MEIDPDIGKLLLQSGGGGAFVSALVAIAFVKGWFRIGRDADRWEAEWRKRDAAQGVEIENLKSTLAGLNTTLANCERDRDQWRNVTMQSLRAADTAIQASPNPVRMVQATDVTGNHPANPNLPTSRSTPPPMALELGGDTLAAITLANQVQQATNRLAGDSIQDPIQDAVPDAMLDGNGI